MRRCCNDNKSIPASFDTCRLSSIVGSFTTLPLHPSGFANTGLIEIVDGHVTKQTPGMAKIQAD